MAAATTRRKTPPKKNDSVFRAMLDQYGFPLAAMAAGGWFAYTEIFVPIRDAVTTSISEVSEATKDVEEMLRHHEAMLEYLYDQAGGPEIYKPRWAPPEVADRRKYDQEGDR